MRRSANGRLSPISQLPHTSGRVSRRRLGQAVGQSDGRTPLLGMQPRHLQIQPGQRLQPPVLVPEPLRPRLSRLDRPRPVPRRRLRPQMRRPPVIQPRNMPVRRAGQPLVPHRRRQTVRQRPRILQLGAKGVAPRLDMPVPAFRRLDRPRLRRIGPRPPLRLAPLPQGVHPHVIARGDRPRGLAVLPRLANLGPDGVRPDLAMYALAHGERVVARRCVIIGRKPRRAPI